MEQLEFCPDTNFLEATIARAFNNVRLDHFLVQVGLQDFSRSQITVSIKTGSIKVNGSIVKPGYRVKTGDVITGVLRGREADSFPESQPVDFDILYEDSSIIVISKPTGLVVQPVSGNPQHTHDNGLLFHFKELADVGDPTRPGIVHRLDKDTSGVMVIARSSLAHQRLVQAFKDRTTEKQYLALVHGKPLERSGRIVAPIGRHPVNRQKMAVRERTGKYAVTSWTVHTLFDRHSLLEVRIETGRTHQIRVHLSHMRYPVAGDQVYGGSRNNRPFARQMLHSWKLILRHPESGEAMTFEAPLAADFQQMLDMMEEPSC
jgi:23S rRNA pseudouridine1911/1915/1917 synthase